MQYEVEAKYINGDKYFDKFDTIEELAETLEYISNSEARMNNHELKPSQTIDRLSVTITTIKEEPTFIEQLEQHKANSIRFR